MGNRARKVQKPGRVGSTFLLSGLLKCGLCGRSYAGQGANSDQFAYYICGLLYREGAGTCDARYLNAPRVEDFIVEKIRGACAGTWGAGWLRVPEQGSRPCWNR